MLEGHWNSKFLVCLPYNEMFWPKNVEFSFWVPGCVIFDQIIPKLQKKLYDGLWIENIMQKYDNCHWFKHKIWFDSHFEPYFTVFGQFGKNLVKNHAT